jgi:hypothetical protein
VRLTLDWDGLPLLLFVGGKPPQPDPRTNTEAWSRWYRTPPKAHHLVYEEAGKPHSIAFDQSQGLSTFHVQPFEGGGDASGDLQTTQDGLIWVSYFDEGVFGGGIGRQGLVCYDATGRPTFKYADFAEQNALPMICDCYAMNVDQTGAVWVNYYMDFPLIKLRHRQVEKLWKEFGVLGNAFAVRGEEVIGVHDKQLTIRDLNASPQQESTPPNAVDEGGNLLESTTQRYADVAGRGASFVLNTGHAIYELCG